jgi:peptide/nickel transport system permease protein
MSIGVLLGVVSGYYGGAIDSVLMRIVDVLLAFPSLVIALAIAGVLGPGIVNAMVGLVSVWWVG